MISFALDLTAASWPVIVAGFLLLLFSAIFLQPKGNEDDPADDEDGEDVPDDPDRWRAYDLAAEAGVA